MSIYNFAKVCVWHILDIIISLLDSHSITNFSPLSFILHSNPENADRVAQQVERENAIGDGKKKKRKLQKLAQDEIDMMNNPEAWDDSMSTTAVWEVINGNEIKAFRDLLLDNPELAHIRSKDGRGPMWWAHEYGRANFVDLLMKLGVSENLMDVNGISPLSLSTVKGEL